MQKARQYTEYLDVLRVLSMFSVLFLHTAAGSLRGAFTSPVWHTANILTGFMSTSVPLFFMISGALILSSEKTASLEFTWKKRMPKLVLPFLFWSFVAIAYFFVMDYRTKGVFDITLITGKLKNILGQPATVHLWFMYALIPLYMISPLLKKLADALDKKLAIYLMVLWFGASSLLPTLAGLAPARFQPLFAANPSYNLHFLGGYIGYFFLGYYLFQYDKKVSLKILTAVILADGGAIALGTWWKTQALGEYSEAFKSYGRVFVLLLSAALFLTAKELLTRHPLTKGASFFVRLLSGASFGMYLVHNLIVHFISRDGSLSPALSLGKLAAAWIIVFALSFLIIFLGSCIKPLCFMATGLDYKTACESLNHHYLLKLFKKRISQDKENQAA